MCVFVCSSLIFLSFTAKGFDVFMINSCLLFFYMPLRLQYNQWLRSAAESRTQTVSGEGVDPPPHCQESVALPRTGESRDCRHPCSLAPKRFRSCFEVSLVFAAGRNPQVLWRSTVLLRDLKMDTDSTLCSCNGVRLVG